VHASLYYYLIPISDSAIRRFPFPSTWLSRENHARIIYHLFVVRVRRSQRGLVQSFGLETFGKTRLAHQMQLTHCHRISLSSSRLVIALSLSIFTQKDGISFKEESPKGRFSARQASELITSARKCSNLSFNIDKRRYLSNGIFQIGRLDEAFIEAAAGDDRVFEALPLVLLDVFRSLSLHTETKAFLQDKSRQQHRP